MTDRPHRSVSQVNQYDKCPLSWKLQRLDKVWSRPAAWFVQGSAVHIAADAYEKSNRTMTLEQMQEVYTEAYIEETAKYTEDTPNFDFWFRSGPYAGAADLERRFKIGLEQCAKYIAWYEAHPEEKMWVTADGTVAAEIGFDTMFGDVPVRGFIDAVLDVNGKLIVRDNKTGNSPGDDFQLGAYGVALHLEYGIDPPKEGDYWMGRSGKPTYPYDLTDWSVDRVVDKFGELDENINAERFDPKPEESKCRFCTVNMSCDFSALKA